MGSKIGMTLALMCIAVLIGVIVSLVTGWLAHKAGSNSAECVIRGGGAFAVATGIVIAIFTFLGFGP
jgi:amino acid transporter